MKAHPSTLAAAAVDVVVAAAAVEVEAVAAVHAEAVVVAAEAFRARPAEAAAVHGLRAEVPDLPAAVVAVCRAHRVAAAAHGLRAAASTVPPAVGVADVHRNSLPAAASVRAAVAVAAAACRLRRRSALPAAIVNRSAEVHPNFPLSAAEPRSDPRAIAPAPAREIVRRKCPRVPAEPIAPAVQIALEQAQEIVPRNFPASPVQALRTGPARNPASARARAILAISSASPAVPPRGARSVAH